MSSRNAPCGCGSGKRYKHCCGALGASPKPVPPVLDVDPSQYTDMGYFLDHQRGRAMAALCADQPLGVAPGLDWVPPGVLVVDDFLPAEECDRLCARLDACESSPALVQDLNNQKPGTPPKFVEDPQRITQIVELGSLAEDITAITRAAYLDQVAPYFGAEIVWMSAASVLKYHPGGLYNAHADSEFWDRSAGQWKRSMDRDYSVLVYLNDDYEGGALYFRNFDVRLKPRKGMLVAFPSDHRYLHAAEELESGTRYAVVSWALAKGSRMLNAMPGTAVFL